MTDIVVSGHPIAIILPEDARVQVDSARDLGREIATARIDTDADAAPWNDRLAMVKRTVKALEATRESMKAPHLEAGRAVDAFFKPLISMASATAVDISGALLRYKKAADARLEAERKRIEDENRRTLEAAEAKRAADLKATRDAAAAEAQAAGFTPEDTKAWADGEAAALPAVIVEQAAVPAPAGNAIASAVATSSVTRRWTFEVTDAAAVPRAFCTPDPATIRAAVRDGVREIPGVRIFQTETLTTR